MGELTKLDKTYYILWFAPPVALGFMHTKGRRLKARTHGCQGSSGPEVPQKGILMVTQAKHASSAQRCSTCRYEAQPTGSTCHRTAVPRVACLPPAGSGAWPPAAASAPPRPRTMAGPRRPRPAPKPPRKLPKPPLRFPSMPTLPPPRLHPRLRRAPRLQSRRRGRRRGAAVHLWPASLRLEAVRPGLPWPRQAPAAAHPAVPGSPAAGAHAQMHPGGEEGGQLGAALS